MNGNKLVGSDDSDPLWQQLLAEARRDAEGEPLLAQYLQSAILDRTSLAQALAFQLGNKLGSATLDCSQLYNLVCDTFRHHADALEAVKTDMKAVKERDPACVSYLHCLLNFKGFQACVGYRIGHKLWKEGRILLALVLQSRISEVFGVDIHPAATIGKGVLFDHATGVVIGETAVVGDNVAILHHVTLGGSGKTVGDRHPKIGSGVLIGAGATILGNIKVGDGAKIGAGAVVLTEVPPRTTAVGCPARLVGGKQTPTLLTDVPSETMDHVSFVSEWSDYVI